MPVASKMKIKRRIAWLVSTFAVTGCALAWMLVDAEVRRTSREAQNARIWAVVRLLGSADMALSFSSRWLRHPTVSEPGAPFADAPAILDADPGGALIGPPRELLAPGSADSGDTRTSGTGE